MLPSRFTTREQRGFQPRARPISQATIVEGTNQAEVLTEAINPRDHSEDGVPAHNSTPQAMDTNKAFTDIPCTIYNASGDILDYFMTSRFKHITVSKLNNINDIDHAALVTYLRNINAKAKPSSGVNTNGSGRVQDVNGGVPAVYWSQWTDVLYYHPQTASNQNYWRRIDQSHHWKVVMNDLANACTNDQTSQSTFHFCVAPMDVQPRIPPPNESI